MGAWCGALRASGVTIILTTHYIEEAEEMADRIGVINKGEIILVEEKAELMRKLGKKQLTLQLQKKLDAVPASARATTLTLSPRRAASSIYTYDTQGRAHRHHGAARRLREREHPLQGPADHAELARGHLRQPGEEQT